MIPPAPLPGSAGGIRGLLARYWSMAEARPRHLVWPFLLALALAGAEGLSLSLLLPLADAVAATNFDFLRGSRAFGWIQDLLPGGLAESSGRDAYLTLVILGLIVAARLAKLGFEYARKLYLDRRNERYRVSIRTHTFARVLSFGRQYFDRQALGRIDAEVGWSASVVTLLTSAEGLLAKLVQLAVKLTLAIAISVPLTLAAAVALPLVQFSLRSLRSAADRIAREGAEAERQLRTEVLDILTTIPLVKAYSQERQATEAYREIVAHSGDVELRRRRLGHLKNPVEEGIILLVILGVQAVALGATGGFNPGELARLAAFLLVAQQCLPNLLEFTTFRLAIVEDIPRLETLAALFDDEGKHIVRAGNRTFPGLRSGIEVKDLTFGYASGGTVFRGLDATFPVGRMTAVVGPSGSGKTTLASLLSRFYDCPPGTILVDGVDIRDFSLESLHARMTLVSQDVWLLNRPLRDNLVWGLADPVPDAVLLETLDDVHLSPLLASLPDGLSTRIGDRGVQLSGGQRQRLALARALLREPEVLILDEATSALDSVVERSIEGTLERRTRGRTLIVIAHRLSTIRSADTILVLDDGGVVERGTWDELLARDGRFAALHRAQERHPEPVEEIPGLGDVFGAGETE